MAEPAPTTPAPARLCLPGAGLADPVLRALLILLVGMILLLAIDLASEPRGVTGEDRAIESALAANSRALAEVTGAPGSELSAEEAERRERAQSAAFFLEQANLAWRRGDTASPEQIDAERGAADVIVFFGKLWMLGWLLLPLGALAARFACPQAEGRHPRWALLYGANALGGSAGFVALAIAFHSLGVPAPFVLPPLVSAIVVLNAWLLRRHAQTDRAATLLRLAPILVILTVGLTVTREILLHLAILP